MRKQYWAVQKRIAENNRILNSDEYKNRYLYKVLKMFKGEE